MCLRMDPTVFAFFFGLEPGPAAAGDSGDGEDDTGKLVADVSVPLLSARSNRALASLPGGDLALLRVDMNVEASIMPFRKFTRLSFALPSLRRREMAGDELLCTALVDALRLRPGSLFECTRRCKPCCVVGEPDWNTGEK